MAIDPIAAAEQTTPGTAPAGKASAERVPGGSSSLKTADDFRRESAAYKLASERFREDTVLQSVARGEQELVIGAQGLAIRRVRLALVETGLPVPGTGADDAFNAAVQQAVSKFQRLSGLPMTGRVDQATLLALDAQVKTIDHPDPFLPVATALDSKRFVDDSLFRSIAAGKKTLDKGADGDEVQKLQLTLLGLGYDLPRSGADSHFGGETVEALTRFQVEHDLPGNGTLNKPTLLKLDDAVMARTAELKTLALAPEEKAVRYRVVADLVRCRAYVIESGSDRPVASYLISPGATKYPTLGTSFTLQSTTVLGWWQPPRSEWAEKLKPEPPGLENPMGILKMSFGQNAQYFHGIPKPEERSLGRPASHGCLRMSGTNVLEFHELYVGPGTRVTLIRDKLKSDRLAEIFTVAGIADRPLTAGRDYAAAYLYGEMGFNQILGKDGRVIISRYRGG